MKANKKTLMAVKNFLQSQEGWDLDELKDEIVHKTKLLKCKEMGDQSLATDECMITWGDEEICVLCEFIDSYTDTFIKNICNVLDSFVGEDLSDYLYDED